MKATARNKSFISKKKCLFASIIIPVYNEELYIKRCILSFINQSYPKELYEIIVIDGNSEDNTIKIINNLKKKYSNIRLYNNPKRITPVSFNIGLKKAKGEIVSFVGAHTIYDKNYIRNSVYFLQKTKASCVGGSFKSVGSNFIGNSIAYAINSFFGAGNAYHHFSNKERYVDTLFGGVYKKETLIKLGGFNEEFVKNQDYELNYRLRKMGGKIFLSPKIKSKYFVRNSIKKLALQYFGYGFWKVKTINEHPYSIVLRQLVPPVFVVSLFISIILLLLNFNIGLFIPIIYFLANLFYSTKIAIEKGMKHFIILPIIFLIIHVAWGIGFIFGLKKFGMLRLNIKIILNSIKNNY